MSKALTFEGYWKVANKDPQLLHDFALETWNAARQGMVPENECVRLPQPEEWPEDVPFLTVYAYDHRGCQLFHLGTIDRPVPAWTPKVGDKVFYSAGDDEEMDEIVGIGIVSGINENGYCAMNGSKSTYWLFVKPFAPEHIGKPWEEIPNA